MNKSANWTFPVLFHSTCHPHSPLGGDPGGLKLFTFVFNRCFIVLVKAFQLFRANYMK